MKGDTEEIDRYWKTICFDIEPVELEELESSTRKTFLMNFMTFTAYLILVLPLPLTLATGAVSYVSQIDVAYYERHCHHYFSRDCPVHEHDSWTCSQIITNCTSPDYPYHCILNTALKVVHVCAATQICHKGTVPLFDPRTTTVSCEICQKGYYQPYEILSDKTPVCMRKFGCDANYHKIECPVEPEKEQTQDTLCRCDARNDYILSHSESRDICVPGKYADCFEWKCPNGQERLLNYTCAPRCEEGFQRNDSDICVPKTSVITTTEGEKASPTSTASTENSSKESSSRGNDTVTIIVVTVAIVLIIAFVVAVCVYWKRKFCCWQFRPVPTDDIDANVIELATMNNDTNENAPSRERPNQVQTGDPGPGSQGNNQNTHHHHYYLCARNLFNCCTNTRDNPSSDDRSSSSSRNRLNPGPMSSVPLLANSPDTNAIASPRDLSNLERPSQGKLHRTVLNRCLPELMQELDVKDVMIYIQQKELFDDVTIRDILEQSTTSDTISMLIKKIQQKSRDTYKKFKKCLVLAGQNDLKLMLEEVEAKLTVEIRETHQAQETGHVSLDMDVSLPGNSLDAI